MKNRIAAVLAMMAMVGFLAIFVMICFHQVPPENREFFTTGFNSLINFVLIGIGYYLGSSHGSSQKNDLLAPPAGVPGLQELKAPQPLNESGFARMPILPLLSLPLLAALALMALMPGCATLQKDTPQVSAGKSLLAVKSSLVAAATTADALCKSEQLSPDTCSKARAAYNLAKPAYDAAVDSYLLMSQGGDPAAFGAALTRVQSITANILQLVGGVH